MRDVGICCRKLRLYFCFVHFGFACEGVVIGGGIIGGGRINDGVGRIITNGESNVLFFWE